jgi:hypothetical protein
MSGESDGLCARRRRRSVVRLLEWRAQLKFAFACCRGRRDRRTFGRAPLHAQSNSSTATTLGIGSKAYRGTSVVVAGEVEGRGRLVGSAGAALLVQRGLSALPPLPIGDTTIIGVAASLAIAGGFVLRRDLGGALMNKASRRRLLIAAVGRASPPANSGPTTRPSTTTTTLDLESRPRDVSSAAVQSPAAGSPDAGVSPRGPPPPT